MTAPPKLDLLQSIVTGLGGSNRSFQALRYALEFARKGKASVRAVVVDSVRVNLAMSLSDGAVLQRLMEEGERLAGEEGRRIAARAAILADETGVPLQVEHQTGSVVDCLTRASAQASLLVVGKRGHREDHGGFLGTNTELLANRVTVPILLTPKEYRPIQEIVVAYAAHQNGVRRLTMATRLCQALKARLRVVTVAKDKAAGASTLEEARAGLHDYSGAASFDVLSGRVATELCKITHAESLLILGASERSRAYHLLLGDVTVEVMRNATGPVLLSSKSVSSV